MQTGYGGSIPLAATAVIKINPQAVLSSAWAHEQAHSMVLALAVAKFGDNSPMACEIKRRTELRRAGFQPLGGLPTIIR